MLSPRSSHPLAIGLSLAIGLAGGCRRDGTDGAVADGSTTDPDSGDSTGEDQDEVEIVPLSATDRLARASMALRGTRPSPQQLAAVEQDPTALAGFVDDYLESPQFGATIRLIHDGSLLLLADYFAYPAGFPPVGPLQGEDIYAINRSVMESPLRLIEHVVMNDLPYSEIVTADYTLANGHVAAVWGLPYDGDGLQWVTTQWDDGRDNAGILSDSWVYQRHGSTLSNANRGRANAISRALLCTDFVNRDIEIDAALDLADPDVVANAVVDNEACAGCHQSLDPLASFFRGFTPLFVPGFTQDACAPDDEECQDYPLLGYYPEQFTDIYDVPMRSPAYFGSPGDEVESLGRFIADDPRFSLCAVQRFYAYFHQIPVEQVPLEHAAALQREFLDSDLNAKALARAIVLADEFAVSHVTTAADVESIEPEHDVTGIKRARPEELSRLVQDLTGFRWETRLAEFVDPNELPYGFGDVDLMEDSFLGFKVLAGGTDAVFATTPSHTFSATTTLVTEALAGYAAVYVVEHDLGDGAEPPRLLTIDASDTDEAAVRAQIVELFARLYSMRVTADADEVTTTYQLWEDVRSHRDDPRRAWIVTLAAMMQDIRLLTY